jgi:hypothetical protein
MQTMKPKILHLLAILFPVVLLQNGCTSGILLSSRPIAARDTGRGSYNLILYGGQNPRAADSVAILDRTDDPYTILPYGAAFNYRIIDNLSADEAIKRGRAFISDLTSYRATEIREIDGPKHTVIGYELRPLFMPLETGRLGDFVDTSYVLQEKNQVRVYVGFRGGYSNPLDSPDFNSDGGRH